MILKIFLTFLKIGFLGFGGGYAMISLIYNEGVHFGMTIEQFADLNALDVLIPGPIAINSATYVGQLFGGFLGAFVATLAVSIPSIVFVPIFMRYNNQIKENIYLAGALESIKSASVGLIFAVSVSLMLAISFHIDSIVNWNTLKFDLFSLVIIVIAFYIHVKFKINPILITLIAGIVGYIYYFI